MDLTILANTAEGRCSLAVTGEVDVSNASELRDAIDGALASEASEVEVDFSDVTYIDSVGAAHRAQEDGRTFVVARPQRNVARVLSLLGVSEELNVRVADDADQTGATE